MSATSILLDAVQCAAAMEATNLIVRSQFAIAEVKGPLRFHCTGRWLRLGEEGGSHVHLKVEAIEGLEFAAPPDANASLILSGPGGDRLCRIVFRFTNPTSKPCDLTFRAMVQARFCEFAPPADGAEHRLAE